MKQNLFLVLLVLVVSGCQEGGRAGSIDRKAVVDRHRILTTAVMPESPAQVGNGEFAFGMDVTGLQTFVPFNTLSHWGWHSFPLPEGWKVEDFKGVEWDTHGRKVRYEMENEQEGLSRWLAGNPHRFNLGRIGFRLLKQDGTAARLEDLNNIRQETDLWSGIVSSRFEIEGEKVMVKTACDPLMDGIGVAVVSGLIEKGRLVVFIDFPYPDGKEFSGFMGDYSCVEKHRTTLDSSGESSARIARVVDSVRYDVALQWDTPASFLVDRKSPHRFYLEPSKGDNMAFTCVFSRPSPSKDIPSAKRVMERSGQEWEKFWKSGAAIDLSGSKDARWRELERRIILSQYLMRVNEAGSLPPQESGLVNNGWFGRFHFEMIWWHGVHHALWNRWDLLDRSLNVYRDFLPASMARAVSQGYQGARWPKCTGNFDREWPHMIHATLIWQQPHPMYFAELDYRLHPSRETLEKWKDVVFSTAEFMSDFAFYDSTRMQYVLGPPVHIVSENTWPLDTRNPTFELSYWRFGLRVAREWRKRLDLLPKEKWEAVLAGLSPLPQEDGLYVSHEGIKDMWGQYAYQHPALIGVFGMLPGDGVDREVFKNTLQKVAGTWDFNRVWGWDFPMLAMAAARCGKTELAVDMLLYPSPNFQFDAHGLATGGPYPYFPSNGALLAAVAMMAGGWDGSAGDAPGFPKDGSWVVKHEGFVPMP